MATNFNWAVFAFCALTAVPAFAAETGQDKSEFVLAASKPASMSLAATPDHQSSVAMPRRPAPAGMQGNVTGEMQYVEGPSWTFQQGSRGPKFEVAALGGGMVSAPFLAHVGVDWRF